MGCDIHLYVERKCGDGWLSNGDELPDHRDYRLFSVLAGVRDYWNVDPLFANRGLPKDVTSEVEGEFGGHSPSWFTVKEWYDLNLSKPSNSEGHKCQKCGWTDTPTYNDFIPKWFHALVAYVQAIDKEARIVFWFDT